MAIKGNILIHVSRQFETDTLYSEGLFFTHTEDGGGIAFNFDLSPNLRQRGESNQKLDTKSLEGDLNNSRIPSRIDVNLSEQGFKKAINSIRGIIQSNSLEKPINWYVNIKILDNHQLKCEAEFDNKDHHISLII
jgi:hypothetical protein